MTSLQLLRAQLDGRPGERLLAMPIIMIWAAKHYGHTYEDYVRDYRTLCECQLRLIDDFSVDIVQLISDPVRETADCGAELEYYDDIPPRALLPLLTNRSDLSKLLPPDPTIGRMGDRVTGARYLSQKCGDEVPVMGWVEGPIAEAIDLRGMSDFMMDLVLDIAFCRDLMDWVVEVEIQFALAQIDAGCHIIGIGDAAASLISADMYSAEVLPREKRIVKAIHDHGAIARLHICGNTNHILRAMAETNCEIVDLDHLVTMEDARPEMGSAPVLLGNFDPVEIVLNGTPDLIRKACYRCHTFAGNRYIVGPGCEVPPKAPEANIRAMIDYAHETAP